MHQFPRQIIISICAVSSTESEQLSYPSDCVIGKKQTLCPPCAVLHRRTSPAYPPPQTWYHLPLLSAGQLPATTTASVSAFRDGESDRPLEALTSLSCCRCHVYRTEGAVRPVQRGEEKKGDHVIKLKLQTSSAMHDKATKTNSPMSPDPLLTKRRWNHKLPQHR